MRRGSSIGLPPYTEADARFKCERKDLLDAIEAVFDDLHWAFNETGRGEYRASTGISFMSWGETVTVEVDRDGLVIVRSACSFPLQWIDWGKNGHNVDRFLARIDDFLDRPRRRGRREREEEDEPRPRRKRVSDEEAAPPPSPPSRSRPRPGDDAYRE